MIYRTGIGYDLHKLTAGRKLILGGVQIDFELGLLGHSDADVLLHAIIDSLLSASGNADIGSLFPDTDAKYKDADSLQLLDYVSILIAKQGFSVQNAAATVICQKPKLAPYILKMREKIARVLKVEIDQIGISCKTNEGVGEVGRSEAICAFASCLLAKN